MKGMAGRILPYLLPAAESVSDQDCLWRGRTHRGQQHPLAQSLRNLILVLFKAKWPGHAAAARIEHVYLGVRGLQQRKLVLHAHQRFLVAMAVEHHISPRQLGWTIGRCLPGEELAEQERLLCQPLCALIRRKKVDQLIPKNAGAAGLEHHESYPGVDLRSKLLQDVQQILTCLVQKTKIVQ